MEAAFPAVQRLAREVSLFIAVLLSQSSRNQTELIDRLDKLGVGGVDLSERKDHFAFSFIVICFLLLPAAIAWVWLVVSPTLAASGAAAVWTGVEGLFLIVTGLISYVVAFRVFDYLRDRELEGLDWEEDFPAYVRILLKTTLVSGAICIVISILAISLLQLYAPAVVLGPYGLPVFVLQQFLIAALAAGFAIVQMRRAARTESFSTGDFWRRLRDLPSVIHALAAGVIVGLLSWYSYSHDIRESARASFRSAAEEYRALTPRMLEREKLWFAQLPWTEVDAIEDSIALIPEVLGTSFSDSVEILEKRKLVAEICQTLNEGVRAPSRWPPPGNDAAASASAPPRSPADFLSERWRIFAKADECRYERAGTPTYLNLPPSNDDAILFRFAAALASLYVNLGNLATLQENRVAAGLIPALLNGAFAFAFSLGIFQLRSWWLHNEADRPDGQFERLKKLVAEKYDGNDRLMFLPVETLNQLTPLEAVRYEDYRSKLEAQVKRKQAFWNPRFLARSERPVAPSRPWIVWFRKGGGRFGSTPDGSQA
jgi:hypothetical protein